VDEARLLNIICQRLSIGSRVNREVHARFWEHLGVRFPRATRQVFIRIGGVVHYLWRAVDQDGVVLDILIQSRRDAGAAKRFFKRLLKGLQYVPRVLITDKLRSYGVAKRELLSGVEHGRAAI
jgi:putative transposase